MKNYFQSRCFTFIAVLFMWIKSYMSYKVEFNLDISDSMQKRYCLLIQLVQL